MSKRIAVFLLAVAVVASPALAGVYYEAVTRSEGKGAEMQASRVKAWAHGESARVEFVESGNPMMAAGGYMVTEDGGKNLFFVNPKEKTFTRFDVEAMGQFVGGASKMVNMKISDHKVENLGEEPGGLVAGLPTTHYRYRTSYAMEMSVIGMKMRSNVVQEQDIWSAPKLVEAALGIWLRKNPPSFGNPEFDAMVKAEMGKMQGFPLKSVTRTTTTDKKGKSETTVTSMEVTKLELDLVPNVSFKVPAGYEEVDMFGGQGGEGNPFAKLMGGNKKN